MTYPVHERPREATSGSHRSVYGTTLEIKLLPPEEKKKWWRPGWHQTADMWCLYAVFCIYCMHQFVYTVYMHVSLHAFNAYTVYTLAVSLTTRFGDPFEILVDGPGAGWHRWNHCCRYQLCFFSSQSIVDILYSTTWWLNQKMGRWLIQPTKIVVQYWIMIDQGISQWIYNIQINKTKV